MDVNSLQVGETYSFTTKDFEVPTGGIVPGETKIRRFVGTKDIGAAGMPKSPFLEVAREDGSTHLIAVESIRSVVSESGS
ncbi:hypothetical protein WL29_22900 [Burkholderia ubonensis]|uniref:Uncharacterized protein n=1 Tax=Burkholderia ubonensis TaxID=101571 RepID=A0A125DMF6_9BURK|nr:hypothetical protein [Burkholderia ubonensis]KWA84212.1 hypothetical protein WL29_22900 [Burkholderia ubonensis]